MEPVRAAGYNERRCIARDALSLYGYIVTLATYQYAVPDDLTNFSEELLYVALKECVSRHAILAAVVQDSAKEKPQLARQSMLKLDEHVVTLSILPTERRGLQTMLETIHKVPFTDYETRPQWRVYIAYESGDKFHLAFACSHALLDGRSGHFFHRAFSQALNNVGNSPFDSSPVLTVPKDGIIPAPLELAGNLAISWSYLLGPLLNEYIPPWLARAVGMKSQDADPDDTTQLWTGPPQRPEKQPTQLPETFIEAAELTSDALLNALSICKSHNARLTGLLLHLAARSLTHALAQQGQEYKKFTISTAIDLRKCLPTSPSEMGVLVSSTDETIITHSTHPNPPNPLTTTDWLAVQSTTRRLEAASRTLADQPVGLLRYLSNYRSWTEKRATSPATTSFEISNLGSFTADSSDGAPGWAIERMVFSQSADATGAPFSLNVAGVDGRALQMVVSWWPGMLGVDDERRLARDVCEGVVGQLRAF